MTQSGTWTVQPGNTQNTTAWLVTGAGGTFPVTGTFWQATQPVSIASMPSTPVTGTVTAAQATAANLKAQVSVAAGGMVAGAGVDGWDATEGTKADTAWVSGSGSVIALLKTIAAGGSFTGNITQWDSVALGAPTAWGTAPSGNVIGRQCQYRRLREWRV